METLAVVKEIGIILLLVGAFGLCVIVAIGLVKLFPHLRRWAEHMATTAEAAAKITGDFAAVSADVAGGLRENAASTAETADHLKGTAKNVMASSAYLRTAMQLLELLGPAGRAANSANMGIGRVTEMVRGIFRR